MPSRLLIRLLLTKCMPCVAVTMSRSAYVFDEHVLVLAVLMLPSIHSTIADSFLPKIIILSISCWLFCCTIVHDVRETSGRRARAGIDARGPRDGGWPSSGQIDAQHRPAVSGCRAIAKTPSIIQKEASPSTPGSAMAVGRRDMECSRLCGCAQAAAQRDIKYNIHSWFALAEAGPLLAPSPT